MALTGHGFDIYIYIKQKYWTPGDWFKKKICKYIIIYLKTIHGLFMVNKEN